MTSKKDIFKSGDVLNFNFKIELRFISQERYAICIDELIEATKSFIHQFVKENCKDGSCN